MVELPGDEGWRPGVVGGAGVGLGLAGEQGGALVSHGDPRGQEVHVEGDRLLHHRPVVVARLTRHIGIEVRPATENINASRDKVFRIRARPNIHIHNPLILNKIYIIFSEKVSTDGFY